MHSFTTAIETIGNYSVSATKAAFQALIISASEPINLVYALGGVIALGLITRYTPAAIIRWESGGEPYTIKSFVIESLCLYPIIYGITLAFFAFPMIVPLMDIVELPAANKTILTYRDEQTLCAQKEGLNGNPDMSLQRKSKTIDIPNLKANGQAPISFRTAICSQISNLSEAWTAQVTSTHTKGNPNNIIKNGTSLTIQTSDGQSHTYDVEGMYAPGLLTTIIWHAFPAKPITN